MSDEPRDGANPDRANLDRENLERANLDRENLDRPNLDRADLDRADLDRANLDRADLDRADLDSADFGSGSAASAPWERPVRWRKGPVEHPTRVDDLLARLAKDDDDDAQSRRNRREAESHLSDAVPASDLIAALSAAPSAGAKPTGTGPTGPFTAADAGQGASGRDASAQSASTQVASTQIVSTRSGPAQDAPAQDAPAQNGSTHNGATRNGSTDNGSTDSGSIRNGSAHDSSVRQDFGQAAGQDSPALAVSESTDAAEHGTDSMRQLTDGDAEQIQADSILAAQGQLGRAGEQPESAADPAGSAPPPEHPGSTVHGSGQPPDRRRGLLYAGRSVVALVAVITLLVMGVEWRIKDRADIGLQQNSVTALDTTDPHISAARTVATTVITSGGVKTTESVKVATPTYAPENILLLGSDTRAGGNGAIGGTDASTADTAQSDTLMVAHISGDRQHVTILSIPRDTIIPAPTCKEWNSNTGVVSSDVYTPSPGQTFHINNAYAVGGPKCTVTAVQSLTGLGITRMIGIDFSGFEAMVNALGGVTVNICRPIIDAVLGTVVAKAGTQVIEGAQAISLVRARDVFGDTQSDLARIRRQQVVLSAILRQVTQAGTLLNPSKLDNFLQAFTKNTFTDNVTLESLVTLAGSLGSLDPAHVTFYTLPTVPSTTISGALDVDQPKAQVVFDDLINDQPLPGEVSTPTVSTTPVPPTPTDAATSLQLTVAPAKVALQIYNVGGRAGAATTAQKSLNAVGFKAADGQLVLPAGKTQIGTTVLYAPANRAAALTVAAAVPGSTLVVTPGLGSTVRLMLGFSYTGNVAAVKVGDQAPASLTTAISTGSSIATTKSATSTTLASTDLSSVNAGAGTCA